MRLFYKKSTSILAVAAIIVLIFLLCMLLIVLTQLNSLKQTSEKLQALVDAAKSDENAKQELIEYRKTDKYVIEWAAQIGLIPEDVINFIQNLDK